MHAASWLSEGGCGWTGFCRGRPLGRAVDDALVVARGGPLAGVGAGGDLRALPLDCDQTPLVIVRVVLDCLIVEAAIAAILDAAPAFAAAAAAGNMQNFERSEVRSVLGVVQDCPSLRESRATPDVLEKNSRRERPFALGAAFGVVRKSWGLHAPRQDCIASPAVFKRMDSLAIS